jgi:hypothetical protein
MNHFDPGLSPFFQVHLSQVKGIYKGKCSSTIECLPSIMIPTSAFNLFLILSLREQLQELDAVSKSSIDDKPGNVGALKVNAAVSYMLCHHI